MRWPRTGVLDAEQLKRSHACVRIIEPDLPVRTLWHDIHNTADRTMEISLHLSDAATGERRTPYLTFGLDTGSTTSAFLDTLRPALASLSGEQAGVRSRC